jgi:hypothetical protein
MRCSDFNTRFFIYPSFSRILSFCSSHSKVLFYNSKNGLRALFIKIRVSAGRSNGSTGEIGIGWIECTIKNARRMMQKFSILNPYENKTSFSLRIQ